MYIFTLKLSKTVQLLAAYIFTIKAENNRIWNKENKTNAEGVSLHQFPQTLDAGQYIWLLPATVHCNILKILIFDHIHFLAKDVFFLPPHCLAVSTLTPCNKKISKVAIFFTMSNRKNRDHNLCDWFHQKEQLSAL